MQIRPQPLSSPPLIAPLPTHVAIIMDGNGRWAQQRHLPRLVGHRAGTENIRKVVQAFAHFGVPYLTLYAFSTENWARPNDEVGGLMALLQEVIHKEAEALRREGVRIKHLGRPDRLSPQLQEAIQQALELTQENTRITLSVAFDYGGRDEILAAVKRIIADDVPPGQVDETLFRRYLYTSDLPDPDLIIRTAGEMRLSNFLLWQSAYSEYYCTPTLWPDFAQEEIQQALLAFGQRRRRFGGLEPQESSPNGPCSPGS